MIKLIIVIITTIFIGFGVWFLKPITSQKKLPELVRNFFHFEISKKAEKEIVLKFTGDVILARSVNFMTIKNSDFAWSFKNVASELQDADLTIINLEAPLISKCPLTNEGFVFCGDARHTQGLSLAGIDIVGMANNHAGNYGKEGIAETISNLDKVGILSSGVEDRQIAYKKIGNTQFAFLAFNSIPYEGSGVLMAREDLIKNLITEAKKNSDFVIVQMHWGTEYTRSPDEYQKKMGRFLIDNGVDLVVGNHPHWVQDYEIYNGKYILYALGNFVFDQEWSQKTKEGVIAKVKILNNKIINLEFTPVEIRNYGQVNLTNKFEIIPQEIKNK